MSSNTITYDCVDTKSQPITGSHSAISRVLPQEYSINGSYSVISDGDITTKTEKDARREIINQYKQEILNIVINDTFENGLLSQSEVYINNRHSNNGIIFIKDALMELYIDNLNDSKILIGLLIMIGSLSFQEAKPQGQTMALGLLQNKDLSVRDRAIQVFEKWNSKEGIPILKSLSCDRVWLQRYVDKVISYLERDGI